MRKKKKTTRADDFVRKNFGKVWPVFVHRYSEYTIACRRNFDGDLDLMLVLAVIGDSTLNARNTRPDLTYNELMSDPSLHVLPEDINASSVSDYSGIPRETVRRKIGILLDKGWVAKNENNHLVATEKSAEDLAPMMEIGIEYLCSMFSLFEEVLFDEWEEKLKY